MPDALTTADIEAMTELLDNIPQGEYHALPASPMGWAPICFDADYGCVVFAEVSSIGDRARLPAFIAAAPSFVRRAIAALRAQPVSDDALTEAREQWEGCCDAINESGGWDEDAHLLRREADAATIYILALERDNADLRARLRRYEEPPY